MSAPVGNILFHHHVLTTSPAPDKFVVSNPTTQKVITRTAAEIMNYIIINNQVKSGSLPVVGGLPFDYLEFARAYNQEPNIWSKFAVPNTDGSLAVSERDPQPRNFGLRNNGLTQAITKTSVSRRTNADRNEKGLFVKLLVSHANATLYGKGKKRDSHRHNPMSTMGRPQGPVMKNLTLAAPASATEHSPAVHSSVHVSAITTSGDSANMEGPKKKVQRKKRSVVSKTTEAPRNDGDNEEMLMDFCEDLPEEGLIASSSKV